MDGSDSTRVDNTALLAEEGTSQHERQALQLTFVVQATHPTRRASVPDRWT